MTVMQICWTIGGTDWRSCCLQDFCVHWSYSVPGTRSGCLFIACLFANCVIVCYGKHTYTYGRVSFPRLLDWILARVHNIGYYVLLNLKASCQLPPSEVIRICRVASLSGPCTHPPQINPWELMRTDIWARVHKPSISGYLAQVLIATIHAYHYLSWSLDSGIIPVLGMER